MNALLLIESHQIHTMVRLACSEYADLCHAKSMGDEVLNQKAPKSIRRGKSVDVAVVVVRAYLSNYRDPALLGYLGRIHVATFDNWEPKSHVHLGTSSYPRSTVSDADNWHGDVYGANCVDWVRAVP